MTDKKRKLKLNLYGTDEEFQSKFKVSDKMRKFH